MTRLKNPYIPPFVECQGRLAAVATDELEVIIGEGVPPTLEGDLRGRPDGGDGPPEGPDSTRSDR